MLESRRYALLTLGALLAGLLGGCKGDEAKAKPDPEALKREAEQNRINSQKERGIKP